MSAAWDKRRITELRDWYKERVRRRLGEAFKVDMSLPVPAAQWLVREAVTQAPRRIVEFGAGFSTLAFARALHALPNCELVSLDHDTDWIKFVHECAKQKGAPMDRIRAMTTHQFLGSNQEPFDMVLVDHGPTYDVRIASIAPIVAMSQRLGCSMIVLDDWHKSKRKKNLYCGPVTRIAEQLGCSVHGIPESSTPSQQRELARLVLSDGVSPLPAYVGEEREYWKRRLRDTSIRSVGRRNADLETNRIEYEAAGEQFQDMLCHDFGDVDPKSISVLDLGFGHGHYQRLCEEIGVGRYHGIDFAAAPMTDLPDGHTTSVGDIGKPFDLQEKFSLVLGIDVLYHLVDDAAFSEAMSNIRRHAKGWIYLTGLFHTHQTTPHVRHRPIDRYMSLGSLETITPWRDNRIGRFRV